MLQYGKLVFISPRVGLRLEGPEKLKLTGPEKLKPKADLEENI